ncbi:MAG: hypothetical protein AAB834_04315 [Patescibacteria group bacterium]
MRSEAGRAALNAGVVGATVARLALQDLCQNCTPEEGACQQQEQASLGMVHTLFSGQNITIVQRPRPSIPSDAPRFPKSATITFSNE